MTPLSTDMAGNVSFLRCTLIRWLILSQQLVRYVVKPLPGKDWDMDVFAFTLCTELWETAKASEKFAFSSLGRGGGGSWKPLPDFKLGGSWRSRWQPSSGSLRSWRTRCMICSSERNWDWGKPLVVWCSAGGLFYGESVSTSLKYQCGYFQSPKYWNHSVGWWRSLRGNCSMCSLVHSWEETSGAFCVAILVWNPQFFLRKYTLLQYFYPSPRSQEC